MKIFISGCMPAYDQERIMSDIPYLDGFIDVAEAREYPAKRSNDKTAWSL